MYEMNSRVRFSETDLKQKMTITALINYFQDLATFHSEDLGLAELEEDGRPLGWMILCWDIKINKLPMMGENIRIVTHPLKNEHLLAYRDFLVYRGEEELARAHSIWAIIDLEKLLPRPVTDEMMEKYGIDQPLPEIWCKRKLKRPESTEEVFRFSVQRFQLDKNGHMNNERYVSAALSALDEDREIAELQVSYVSQAVYGDTLVVKKGLLSDELKSGADSEGKKEGASCKEDAGKMYAVLIEKEDSTVCCQVNVRYQER